MYGVSREPQHLFNKRRTIFNTFKLENLMQISSAFADEIGIYNLDESSKTMAQKPYTVFAPKGKNMAK